MASYYLLKAISWLCCHLPRGFCEALGRFLGAALWPLVPRKRKQLAFRQVKKCLGVSDAEAWRIARASSVRFGPMLFEVLRFPVIRAHIADYVRVEGLEKLQQAMKEGKGGIIATGHCGNWELMGGAFAQYGIPLVGVAMQQKSAGADRFIMEYRTLIGMHITYKTGVREMFRMLKEGWFIGLIMDQDTNRHDGIILDFFGQPTNCVPGAASMSRFQQAPIFPCFMHRHADGTHTLCIGDPVYTARTKDKQAGIRETSQLLTHAIERHIRRYPEEWFWLHDRWKSMRP